MGFVKGIAAGTAWGAAAEAMLVEVLDHRRVGQWMIALERQQIIAPARQDPLGNRDLTRNSPDTGSFAASIAPFTGFANGKSPSPRAKCDRDLPLKRSTAEARPICLHEGVPLP